MPEELPIEATITRVELTRDDETGEHHMAAYAGDTLLKSSPVPNDTIEKIKVKFREGGPLQVAPYDFGDDRPDWIHKHNAPGGLNVPEWCRYWNEGNADWVGDGMTLEQMREDLAWAAATIRQLVGLDPESPITGR
jgi:hypothetical protein